MTNNTIVALVHVFDQVDLLDNFFSWYSKIGVNAFLVQDMGSTDGTIEALHRLGSKYPIDWFRLEERDLRKTRFGNTGDEMVTLAREKFDPKWLLMCDADEFLILENDPLALALEKAEARGITSINIPCYNMTGAPLSSGADAVASLSLRIVKPYIETMEQQVSGILPRPYIFIRHPHKSIVMATAFSGYVAGSHGARVTFGKIGEIHGARFNHYSIRGFDKFEQKVHNSEAFLIANNHLESWWAWHWRRWIKLEKEGHLKEDYDAQFVLDSGRKELLESGICVVDNLLPEWVTSVNGKGIDVPRQKDQARILLVANKVQFQDWFLSSAAFALPDRIESVSELEVAPFIFWLIDEVRPSLILNIGIQGKFSHFTFCQALDQSALDGKCINVRDWKDADAFDLSDASVHQTQLYYQLKRHHDRLSVVDSSLGDALREMRDKSIDILSLDVRHLNAIKDAGLKELSKKFSDRGLILINGINRSSFVQGSQDICEELFEGRMKFELFHGDGLAILSVGTSISDAVREMFHLSGRDVAAFREIYGRLGAGVPKPHLTQPEQDSAVDQLRKRIETLTREKSAFEGGCRERDEEIFKLRNVKTEYEARLNLLEKRIETFGEKPKRSLFWKVMNRRSGPRP